LLNVVSKGFSERVANGDFKPHILPYAAKSGPVLFAVIAKRPAFSLTGKNAEICAL